MDYQPADPSDDVFTSHIIEAGSQQPQQHGPGNGLTYTTAEIDAMFHELDDRLTGYAESLLGVANCLDSLQQQINAFQNSGTDNDSIRHAVDESEWEGQKSIGEKREEPEEERPEGGGDGEVNDDGLGNIISGFVFGKGDGKDGKS